MFRLVIIFTASVFLSLNFGALLYVNSTYLGQFFPPSIVSLIFVLGALGNILLFFVAPRFIRRLSLGHFFPLIIFLLILSNLELALAPSAIAVGAAFILYSSFIFMAYYCLDIMVEELSDDRHTGELRGLYGTFMNAGIAGGPVILAIFVHSENLRVLYLLGAILLLFAWIPFRLVARSFCKKEFTHQPLTLPLREWWRAINIRRVTLAKLVLEIFFGLMVIYTPLYLHGELGFSWVELGFIFTIALLPFVLFEWPVGELADRLWGEKEMMSLGFFITGVSLLVMPFLGKNFLYWLSILFLSRVGASIIEITTDSYFFKQINVSQVGLLSIFRLMRPLGVVLGSTLGVLALEILSFQTMFFLIAFIVFLGIRQSARIKDTR